MAHKFSKHTAKNDPELKFWVQKAPRQGGSKVDAYMVVSQVDGWPGTEACDDWFGDPQVADDMAKKLAEEAPAPDAELLAMRKARK